MASSLIDSMAGEFQPDTFTDDYRAALQEVIDAKVEGREVVQPEEAEEAPAAAVDLMAALRASVDRARAARGEEPSGESREPTPIFSARSARKQATPDKAAPEKATKKKAAPKKTGAGKAAAKKAGASKPETAKKTATKKATPAKKAAARKATPVKKAGGSSEPTKTGAAKKTARKSA